MQYENRQPKEGINVSQEHPLKQFFQLVVGALILVVVLVVLLQVSGGWLAKRVPFSFELALMKELDVTLGNSEAHPQMTEYLNDLSQRVASHMDLPEGMQITVHYNPQDVFNAFATVGGNLMFYRGLLENMPNENTLAMVMAHEIAHIYNRDPVASLGGGVASTLALLAFTGSFGSSMAGSVFGSAGTITGMQFTRGMEVTADEYALSALNASYGHVNGAIALFDLFKDARGAHGGTPKALDSFFSTHPLDQDRVGAVIERANSEAWSLEGPLTSLPDGFDSWL
ncbi:MAG: M48 family metallopeptidase [Granulosicoccus sp.]